MVESVRRPPEDETARPAVGGEDRGQGPGIAGRRARRRGPHFAAGHAGEPEGEREVEAEERVAETVTPAARPIAMLWGVPEANPTRAAR